MSREKWGWWMEYRGNGLPVIVYKGEGCHPASKEEEQMYRRLELLEKGIRAVQTLIEESHGVSGLHLNGDIAPWDSLLEGGNFEEWLLDYSEALRALEGADDDG